MIIWGLFLGEWIWWFVSKYRLFFFLLFLIIFYLKYNFVLVITSPSLCILIIIWSINTIINAIRNKTFNSHVRLIILFFLSVGIIIFVCDIYISNRLCNYNIFSSERYGMFIPFKMYFDNLDELFYYGSKMKSWQFLDYYFHTDRFGWFLLEAVQVTRPIWSFIWRNGLRFVYYNLFRPIRNYLVHLFKWTSYKLFRNRGIKWIIRYSIYKRKQTLDSYRLYRLWLWRRAMWKAERKGQRKYGYKPRRKRRQYK